LSRQPGATETKPPVVWTRPEPTAQPIRIMVHDPSSRATVAHQRRENQKLMDLLAKYAPTRSRRTNIKSTRGDLAGP